ncbi:MAG TPA: hypothetical protein VMB73_11765 [Acetobacteraceae bacterium]|nr:hypothetical protein [Acetobacteraceae bacterium]
MGTSFMAGAGTAQGYGRARQDAAIKVRRPAISSLYNGLKDRATSLDRLSRLHDRFRLDDRRRGRPVLVCLLAGYKPQLWPFVIPRMKASLPEADVCILSPGLRNARLAELCSVEGWSYLSTATNDVSLAQNVCYNLHPAASMIVKLDEDMFLLPETIRNTLTEYTRMTEEGALHPGCVAPVIPLNGFCYRHLLELLGLLGEYESRFGIARMATSGISLQTDPAAATWIWEKTTPLSTLAKRLAAEPIRWLPSPIQFSIGLIAFERAFWEEIGYFPVYRRRLLVGASTLGGDEAYLCAKAVETSRPVVVTTAAVAGHFSFAPQYAAMKTLLDSRPEMFER